MYKLSKFNSYIEDNGDLKIVNSLSGKMVLIPKKNKNNFIKEVINVESHNLNYIKRLEQYGLIVPEDFNEMDFADVAFYDYATENRLSLILIPYFDCNFRCKYCYEYFNDIKISMDVINRIEKFVKNSLNDKKSLSVTWFGGEPLEAYGEMVDIMKKLSMISKEEKKVFTQGIITNGYNLTPDVVNTLVEYRCMHIQVTIDGTEEIHNKYRPLKDGQGSFATIINNLRYIRDNVKSRYLSITIRTNITTDLVYYISEYIEFLENEFSKDKRFKFLWRFASDWGGNSVTTMLDQLGDTKLLQKCFEYIKDSKLNGRAHTRLFRKCGSICDASTKNHFVIGPDAKVFKCTMKLYNDDDINNIGYIDENGIMSIDKRKEALWRTKSSSVKCNSCSFYAACFGMSCPAQRIYNSEINCPYDKRMVKEIISVLSNNNGSFIKLGFDE